MSNIERHSHWQNIYQTKGERDVSWFQESPRLSLDLIRETGAKTDAPIIAIGGGASRLVDALLNAGFERITVLDLSDKAFAMAKARLGARSTKVKRTQRVQRIGIKSDDLIERLKASTNLHHHRGEKPRVLASEFLQIAAINAENAERRRGS